MNKFTSVCFTMDIKACVVHLLMHNMQHVLCSSSTSSGMPEVIQETPKPQSLMHTTKYSVFSDQQKLLLLGKV
jgi:hypothetical protein